MIYDTIESHLDFDYRDTVWHNIDEEWGDQVYEEIVQNPDKFIRSLASASLNQAIEGLEEADLPEENPQKISSAHLSTQINTGQIEYFSNPDFSHSVGNWAGYRMADTHDIEANDLRDKEDNLLNLARRATDLSFEIGRHESGAYKDFQRGIDFLIEDEGFI